MGTQKGPGQFWNSPSLATHPSLVHWYPKGSGHFWDSPALMTNPWCVHGHPKGSGQLWQWHPPTLTTYPQCVHWYPKGSGQFCDPPFAGVHVLLESSIKLLSLQFAKLPSAASLWQLPSLWQWLLTLVYTQHTLNKWILLPPVFSFPPSSFFLQSAL